LHNLGGSTLKTGKVGDQGVQAEGYLCWRLLDGKVLSGLEQPDSCGFCALSKLAGLCHLAQGKLLV